MKTTLIIGTLILALSSGTVLADNGDDMRAVIQLQEQSYALGQMAQAQQMRNSYIPYGYYGYSTYPSGYYGYSSYPSNFPYTSYYSSAPPASIYYPYPTEHTVVIPVPSANEIYNSNDINYSTYTQRTVP